MEPSEILVASLGAIAVLVVLYAYIFAFERRLFLLLWMAGWVIIGLNYSADAFAPQWLRESRLNLLISLGSYFIANVLIAWGSLRFLGKPVRKFYYIVFVWPLLLILFSALRWTDLQLIQCANLAVLILYASLSVVMMRLTARCGKLIFGLGLMNLAWVLNNAVFVYVLRTPQLEPFIVSHMILLINAAGLVLLFFRQQKKDIEYGLAHIAFLTQHDDLTGLYNKAYFDNRIQKLRFSDRVPISVLIGDMNGLKLINDIFGHKEGDAWLKSMADIIRRYCRENDVAARWGGDEFAIILPDTACGAALELCDRINESCACSEGFSVPLSISIGVATKTEPGEDLISVLKRAEDLMYEKKLIEGKKAKPVITEAINKLQERKDLKARQHIAWLERIAADFAEALKLNQEHTEKLILAMRLHDLGRASMAGEATLKKAPANKVDWAAVKKHVGASYRIARASEEFTQLADIMLCHHEWWNGQGYPQGLKGEDIPLLSRIIAILDAFNAMTGGGMCAFAAMRDMLEELNARAGQQFDPRLIMIFNEIIYKQQDTSVNIIDNCSDKDNRVSILN
jgi:diguanylate cyclase (GGDEF)-like protein